MTAELGSLYFSFLYFLNRQKDCRDSYGNLNENFRREINPISKHRIKILIREIITSPRQVGVTLTTYTLCVYIFFLLLDEYIFCSYNFLTLKRKIISDGQVISVHVSEEDGCYIYIYRWLDQNLSEYSKLMIQNTIRCTADASFCHLSAL